MQCLDARRRCAMFATCALILVGLQPTAALAIEEPPYQLVGKLGDVELRQYGARVVAELRVPGATEDAGRQGFPALARYIFGENNGNRRLPMTAPAVLTAATVAAVPGPTPATGQPPAAGGTMVTFILPAALALTDAPEPTDPRVHLRTEPAGRVAVIRYTGFWTDANDRQHLQLLEDALDAAQVAWSGPPVYARYDPPYMPWFWRRNEVWLHLP